MFPMLVFISVIKKHFCTLIMISCLRAMYHDPQALYCHPLRATLQRATVPKAQTSTPHFKAKLLH